MPYDAGDDAGKETAQSMSRMTRDFVSRYVFPRVEESLNSIGKLEDQEPGRAPSQGSGSPGFDLMVMTYYFDSEAMRDAFVERLEEKGILVQPNVNPINGQYIATVAFDPLLKEGSFINATLTSLGYVKKAVEEPAKDLEKDTAVEEPGTDAPLPTRESGAAERDPGYSVSVDEELEDAAAAIRQEEAASEIGEAIVDIAEKVR